MEALLIFDSATGWPTDSGQYLLERDSKGACGQSHRETRRMEALALGDV